MGTSILERIAKKNYILPYPSHFSGFLLPDGGWVDLISKEDADSGFGVRDDHRSIIKFTNHKNVGYGAGDISPTEKMYRFMVKTGAIRFFPEGDGFEFTKKPTWEQANAIFDYAKDHPNCCVEKVTYSNGIYDTAIFFKTIREFRKYWEGIKK